VARGGLVVRILLRGDGACRRPRSCPTRRSSDLFLATGVGLASGGVWQCEHMDSKPVSPRATRSPSVRSAGGSMSLLRLMIERMRDRKSTRLNSSHVKNSYAVFCLKKKNASLATG